MYFTLVSFSELLGEEGLLRLPEYLSEVFVFDSSRESAIIEAVKLLSQGKNVLIEGKPGVGKTALMFMVLKRLSSRYSIGRILEGPVTILNEHLSQGIILFYDDLPRMNSFALKSIFVNNVGGIIATARSEEIPLIKKLTGYDVYKHFYRIVIPPMNEDKLKEMFLKYLNAENIRIRDKRAIDYVVRKAEGLPVYIWHVIRDLKMIKADLDLDFAKRIPQGMLDYIDDILWRILSGRKERYEALVMLLAMTEMLKYEMHQDILPYIYLLAKERRLKKFLSIDDVLFDETYDAVLRYLARDVSLYAYRLPHDCWADVLRGKSKGPLSAEITKLNAIYKREELISLIVQAANRAWHETLRNCDDKHRVDAFKEIIRRNFGEEILEDIIRHIPKYILERREISITPIVKSKIIPAMPLVNQLMETLSSLKVTSIEKLASVIGANIKEVRDYLRISDFCVFSKKREYVYWRDHFIKAITQARRIIQEYGTVDINELASNVGIFPEDIAEHIGKEFIVTRNEVCTIEFFLTRLLNIAKEEGFVNLMKISEKMGVSFEKLKALRPMLAKFLISDLDGVKFYQEKYLLNLLGEKLKISVIKLEELVKHFNLSPEIIRNLLSKIDGVVEIEKNYFTHKEFIEKIKNIVNKTLKEQKMFHISSLMKLGFPRNFAMNILKEIAEQSPSNPEVFYPHGYLKECERILKGSTEYWGLSISEIARRFNILESDAELLVRKLGGKYYTHRLRRLLNERNYIELKHLLREIDTIKDKFEFTPEEMNLIGVAYALLWRNGLEDYRRAVYWFERSKTAKAYANLAIIYGMLSKWDNVKDFAKKAMKLGLKDKKIKRIYAKSLYELGDVRKALKVWPGRKKILYSEK